MNFLNEHYSLIILHSSIKCLEKSFIDYLYSMECWNLHLKA